MKLESDRWLTEVFGYPVFKALLSAEESGGDIPALSAALHGAADKAKAAFFYAKVPTTRIDQVSALSAAGFTVVDVSVTFERSPLVEAPVPSTAVVVREARPADEADVLNLAASCFVYSRFHLDPLISTALANTVKREWVANYFRHQRGEQLLVAEVAGAVAGFLAVLRLPGAGGGVRAIDLIGVDKARQGRGVGRHLVESLLHASAGQCARLRVGTQIANLPSIRLYERCGFHLTEAAYVLHAHWQKGEVKQ